MAAFDLEGARQAGYNDAEIASYLAPQIGFDLEGATKAGYTPAEIVDSLAASPKLSDYLKSAASGTLSGAGMIAQGGGELLARGVNAVAPQAELRSENPFQGAIDWLETSKSPGAKRAEAGTQISGSLLHPSTWDFGSNPTMAGLALQGFNAIGQFAPNLAIALGTAGTSVPAQLTIGATVGGLQALGGGAEQERDVINAMGPDELAASSELYRTLTGRGVDPQTAKNAVAEAAALGGGMGNAIPSAAEGAFENFLVGAITRGKFKIPSLGGGLAGRVATGAVGGAALGGTEEAVEQASQNLGSNLAIGGNRPLTADTLQQFVMGAIAEGTAGGGGGALSHVTQPKPVIGTQIPAETMAAGINAQRQVSQGLQALDAAPDVDTAIQAAASIVDAPVSVDKTLAFAQAEAEAGNQKATEVEAAYQQREDRIAQLNRMIEMELQRDAARTEAGRQDELARRDEVAQADLTDQTRGTIAQAATEAPQTAMSLALARAAGAQPPGYVSQDEFLQRMEEWNRRQNAVREQSTGAVDVRNPPANGEGVGVQNAQPIQPAAVQEQPAPAQLAGEPNAVDAEIARRMTASIPQNTTPQAPPQPFGTPSKEALLGQPLPMVPTGTPEGLADLKKRTAQIDAYKRRNAVDQHRDSLFSAIAKLGGLNKQEVVSSWGVDPADIKKVKPIFGKPLLRTNGGMSIDGMAELLQQYGYLDQRDLREFEAKFDQELRGKPVLTIQGHEQAAQQTAAQTEEDQKAESLGLTHTELVVDGYEALNEPEKEQAQSIIDALVQHAQGKPYEALVDAILERAAIQAGDRPYREYAQAVITQIREVIANAENPNNQPAQVERGAGRESREEAHQAARPERRPEQAVVGSDLTLTGQTAAEVKEATNAQARSAAAQKQREAAPPPEAFTLAGSNRPADQANARGQQELVPVQQTVTPNASDREGAPNALSMDAQGLRDAVDGKTFVEHGFGGLDVESQRVVLHQVSRLVEDNKILDAIIPSIPVKVMNVLSAKQLTPKMFLHDEAMLRDYLLRGRISNTDVGASSGSDLVRALARIAAENVLVSEPARIADNIASAERTGSEHEQNSTTVRPYRSMSPKELQKIYHETDDQEQLHAVEDEINLRAEEKAKNREDRLAKGRQAKRTKEQVLADLYALTAKWEERRANAKDESIKMLRPTPSDWSTTEELNRYTDLQAELVPFQPQPGFDITPAMRDKAMQGMALFQPKSEYNPEQADHIYDNAQTRPGTTGEQRQLGIAAIKALFGGDRRAGSTILGSALWRDFQEHKGVELVGQRAKSSKDLATLAQILRDPRFETFRIFFTAGDKIVGHSGMTSRLPGQVAVFVPNRGENINEAMERRIEEFQKMKDAFGADGYWILHNHPSGSSHPSSADETITTLFAESMVGFKGHVVIDHDEFSTINAEGDSRTHDIKSGARSEPEVVHELLGRSISSTEQFSDLGKQIQAKSGYDVMISTDHQGKVSGIAEVPTQLLLQGGRSIIRARRFARGTGGDRVFVVSQNPSRLERLVASGAVTDATDYAGHKSLQTLGIGMASGERTTGYKAKVLPAEQKKSEYDQTQTEAFKRWFGDSKVVDADGKPLVVYHGSSTQGIDIFDPSKAGDVQTSDWGKGIYFTPSKGQADGYREEAAVRSDKEDERLWGEYEAAAKRLGTTPMMAGIDLGHGSDAYNSLNEYEKRWRDNRTAVRKRSDLGHVYSAYLRLEKPLDYTYEGMTDPFLSERAKAQGHDGIIIRHDDGSIDEIVVFRPEQIKSATGNRGTFNPESKSIIEQPRSPYIGGSNTTGDARDTYVRDASDWVRNLLHSDARVGWWAKSVGTQQHKALTLPAFKPVYDEGQAFLSDVSKYANGSADLAQDLLPRIEGFRDFLKKNAKPADIASAHDALMAGTLFGGGSPLEGRVWTDKELKSGRATMGNTSLPAFKPLTDAQIKLYREALAATSKSLEELGKSMIHRTVSVHGIGFDRDMSLDDVVASVNEQIKSEVDNRKLDLAALHDRAVEASKDDRAALLKEIDRVQAEIAELEAAKTQVADISEKTTKLKQHGYFPAMRFGKYAVHVVDAEDKQLYFSLFESQTKANIAAAELKKQYPDANIYRAIMSQEQHRLFQGLSLDALETFADYITGADGKPLSKDPIVQGFLKAAVADRSVLKRHIHRKGVAGFSEDMPRVLANFTTAAARHTAMSYHGAEMARLANDIKAGDVKDEAIKLVRYLQDPMEEAQGIRAFLFAQYLGGSLANGLVNMTQPFMVTGPYLTQTTSASDAAIQLMKAAAVNPQKLTGAERNAYDKAHREGVVSPQEIHQLRAQTGGLPLAKNLALRKLSYLWGSIYALTEQFNRTTTFVAAYRIAEKKGIADPYEFAKEAVQETQFVYNKGNRPNWARGPVGATVFTFKQFSISYLELAHRLYKHDKKAFALMALMLLAAGGIEGLPFAEDIEDMVDTMGQWLGYATNSKKKVRQWAMSILGPDMSQIALRGVSGLPWMPVDVSARMGMSNLIPGTALLKQSEKNKARDVIELVGPVGQLIPTEDTMLGRALERLAKGDVEGAIKAGAPRAVQAVVKGAEQLSTGNATDIRGRKITKVTPGEAVLQMAGLNPSGVARESQRTGIVQQDLDLQNRMKAEISEQWSRGIMDKEPDQVKAARKKLADWNADNPELPIHVDSKNVIARLKEMRMSREQRFIKHAAPEVRGAVREALR